MKKSFGFSLFALAFLLLLQACSEKNSTSQTPPEKPKRSDIAERLVQQQLEAYNNRDIDAFLKPFAVRGQNSQLRLYIPV